MPVKKTLKKKGFSSRAWSLLAVCGLRQGMRSFWPIRIRFGSFSRSLFASKIVG